MSNTRPQLADTTDLPPASEAQRFFAAPDAVLSFQFGTVTHPGRVRDQNEDRYALVKRTRSSEVVASNVDFGTERHQSDDAYALVVADGIGGDAFGEFASELAIRTAWEWAGRAASWLMRLHDLNAQQVQERVDAFAKVIQTEMAAYESAHPRLHGMGTTWTSAYIINRDVIIAHVGDSRAYLLHQGKLSRLTHDHTLAEDLIAEGAKPESVRRFRSMLTRALRGDQVDVHYDVAHVRLDVGDVLLVCSDGLTDVVSTADIAQTLSAHANPQSACDALLAQALAAGGPDNITILAARVVSAK